MCEEYYQELVNNPGNDRSRGITHVCTRIADVTISQDECGTVNYHAHHCGGYGIPPENLKYRII